MLLKATSCGDLARSNTSCAETRHAEAPNQSRFRPNAGIKEVDVDQPPKRSLADDPNFLASLAELERGLNDLNEALVAVEQGPLPSAAITRLEGLWATDFR